MGGHSNNYLDSICDENNGDNKENVFDKSVAHKQVTPA